MLSLRTLQTSMNRFWKLKEFPNATFLSEEEFKIEKHLKETTTHDLNTGQYTVHLPFNEKNTMLGESRKLVERQFYSLERKLTL
jgi:hypothetical protein